MNVTVVPLLTVCSFCIASCNYIDPTVSTPTYSNTIVVECSADEKPAQWHIDVYDDLGMRPYNSYDGKLSVEGSIYALLAYNTNIEKVRIKEQEESGNMIATTDAIGNGLTFNGQPVVNMPDMLYSAFIEDYFAGNVETIEVEAQPRVFVYNIEIEITDSANIVSGCRSAMVDGLSEYVDLMTLLRSSSTVAMEVPMQLNGCKASDGTKTALGTLTTFGLPTAMASRRPCRLTLRLVDGNGSVTSTAIDITDKIAENKQGGEITLSVDAGNIMSINGDIGTTIENRNEENIHIRL